MIFGRNSLFLAARNKAGGGWRHSGIVGIQRTNPGFG